MARHILRHIELFNLPLSILRGNLPLRGLNGSPSGRRRQLLLLCALQLALQECGENTVDHQVRIAADR